MRILERIAERNEDPGGQPPVLIAFLGDSVTHGCFELRLNGRRRRIPLPSRDRAIRPD